MPKSRPELSAELKQLLVEDLMLKIPPEQIPDNQPLFGPDSLGLDSVDALQLVVALEKRYGLKIATQDSAKSILRSLTSMTDAVSSHLETPA